jgi:hypothetical protein
MQATVTFRDDAIEKLKSYGRFCHLFAELMSNFGAVSYKAPQAKNIHFRQ